MSLASRLPRAPLLRARLLQAGVFAGCAVAAASALIPGKAEAYWYHGYWRRGVVVVAPPVVYAPPVIVRHGPYWVPGHYDWRGFWHRGHWA